MKTYQTEKKAKPQSKSKLRNPFQVDSQCECGMRMLDKHNCQLATCNCPDWLCHKLWQALPNVNFSLIHSLTQSTTLLLLSAEMRADDTVLLLLFFSFLCVPRTDCRYFMANADARRLRWRCCRRQRWLCRWRRRCSS